MSQQSLASKKMTKRNVAQSTAIFSVVVALITLGVIGGVAYMDFTKNNHSASLEKSIPELIVEQKIRLEENQRQIELISQAEDLVLTLDQRVEDLKQLDDKVKNVNERLNFVSSNFQTGSAQPVLTSVKPAKTIHIIKAVQYVNQTVTLTDLGHYQPFIKSVFNQNYVSKINHSQQMNGGGEGYLEFSWLFKARGSMTQEQHMQLKSFLNKQVNSKTNNQTDWSAKSL